MSAAEELVRFRARIFLVGNAPQDAVIIDLMKAASERVSPHPEDWCLDASPDKKWVICHAPNQGTQPVNSRVTFLAGRVIYGNAIAFDYAQMADEGYLPPEGE